METGGTKTHLIIDQHARHVVLRQRVLDFLLEHGLHDEITATITEMPAKANIV